MKKNKKENIHHEKNDDNHSKSNHKKSFMVNNLWKIISFVLFVLLIVSVVFVFTNQKTKELSCSENIGKETTQFLIDQFQVPELTLVSTKTENNVCVHTYKIQGQEIEIITSIDGEIVVIPGLGYIKKSDLNLSENQNTQSNTIPKVEKPTVELFVMSHCPYGTQVEKGILPVVDLLSDKINFEVKFVNYVMHDLIEVQEQLLQYCIQESSKEKYREYLYCFLEDGNTERCLEETNILRDSLSSCIKQTNDTYKILDSYTDKSSWLNGRYPKFLIYDKDNLKYDVKGSPTLVINGTVVNSNRDSQSLLDTICEGFVEKPRACNEKLSRESPTPGFGFSKTTTSTTNATCG